MQSLKHFNILTRYNNYTLDTISLSKIDKVFLNTPVKVSSEYSSEITDTFLLIE